MARIYIDINTSIMWRRPPVGIVRVEREFAKHCLVHEPDSVFCEVGANGQYRAIEPSRVRAILDDSWCQPVPSAAQTEPPPLLAPVAPPAPVRGRIQRLFDWAALWGPKVVPAAAYPLLRDIGRVLVDHHAAFVRHRAALRAMREAAASAPVAMVAPAPAESPAMTDPVIAPTSDDLFFSIGAQWHHNAIHAYRLKQTTGVRVVEACYDTIPIDFPEYSGTPKQVFAEFFTCIAHSADLVFAISDTTRTDLGVFYANAGLLRRPPIHTVHLATPEVHRAAAVDELAAGERETLARVQCAGEYVLYVSTFEARKNHRLLLQVWRELHRQRGADCPLLVLVGMFGWGVNDLWTELQATDVWGAGKVVLLHHVSDALLGHLYRGCAYTVFPSIYEGWGLAATESLAYGKLALVSDTPALREATQGLCPAIHPLDYPGWLAAISHYLDDVEAREAAEAHIRSSYTPRYWSDFSVDLLSAARTLP